MSKGIVNVRSQMIVSLLFLSVCGVASVVAEPLRGDDQWAGIPRHPAVVNSVTYAKDDPNLISLRGEWEYVAYKHGTGWRQWGFPTTNDWPIAGKLKIPGCWEAQGVGEPAMGVPFLCQDQAPKDVRHFFRGEVWYRRQVEIPRSWTGKRIWIKTGGIRSCGWIWVNDHPVARVAGFCSAWKYEITPFVKPGEKTKVVIIASNAFSPRNVQLNCANRWGGPWRDIELEATPSDCFIDDAWVRGDFDRQEAEVHVEIGGKVERWKGGKVERWKGGKVRATVEDETVEVCFDNQTVKQSNFLV